MLPQFQRLVFVEVLAVGIGLATWLKMAKPLLPLSCTGAVAWLFMANTNRNNPHITRLRIYCLLMRVLILSVI